MTESSGSSAPAPRATRRCWPWLLFFLAVLVCLGGGALYRYITHGGLIARQAPSALEAAIAHRLVDWSIPAEERARRNPLQATSATLEAGRALYQKNCEVCHGNDGMGMTAAGDGMYPPPAVLGGAGDDRHGRSDGELFYLIRNGIRNTAMPGWQLPERETWQLVSYLRHLPLTAPAGAHPDMGRMAGAHYVGSASCKECHREIYEHWQKTPMANVVRDPKEHPEAITPDLSQADPLVKFAKEDIAFVYGSIWKQRYFKKVGGDYFPFPAQWDVTHRKWKPYVVKDDWWVPDYPPDNMQRPTGPLCDGCHSVNYDIKTKKVTEWNVGCEKCHGPGSEHVRDHAAATIVNPARMDYVAGNDNCIQCHSQGRPPGNPIDGKYYDWPVGYEVTKKLSDYWKLEEHKLGETTFTHFADGTAHKNRMQGNDYVQSLMYARGVTCYTCHDVHGTEHPAQLRKPAQQLCLDCHGPNSPSGPHAPTLEAHTHHKTGSKGSECIECHMPKIAQTIGDVNVRSHSFRFVSPGLSESQKVPNACNACHADKPPQWAAEALKSWTDRSPWRVVQ